MTEKNAQHATPLSYVYEPTLDAEVIAGRLLMTFFIFAHTDNRYIVDTSISKLIAYTGLRYGETNWKRGEGIRILDKGLAWLIDNDMVEIIDGGPLSLTQRTFRKGLVMQINYKLFDMKIDQSKDRDPYFQIYEDDAAKIFSSSDMTVWKLFHVFCYIKAWLPGIAPYAWCVPIKNISGATGYSPTYISKALQILCDEIGVLHRQRLKRDSESVPPYVYISDFNGWEVYLQEKVDQMNEIRGSAGVKNAGSEAHSEPRKSQEQLADGSRVVEPEELPPDIRKVFFGY